MSTETPSVYDRLRERMSAEDILSRLGVEIIRQAGNEVHLAPLCHTSSSGESLHLNTDTGRWLCFACAESGMSGDLFQFVEYVLSGGAAPSKGVGAMRRESHVAAVRWLCEQYVIPFDSVEITLPAEMEALDQFAGLAHDYLVSGAADHVLDWIQEQWGFSRDVVETFHLGFMPSPLIPELLQLVESSGAFRNALRSAGVGFMHSSKHQFVTPFEGRVTFPYLEHGRAVYLIGRATPWTPKGEDGSGARAKYYKLPVHSEKRTYISPRINNTHLFNDGALSGCKRVLLTEGVADAVAIASTGVRGVVSPVGLSAREDVAEALAARMRREGAEHVDIAYDAELSGSGSQGARASAVRMIEHGMSVSILTFSPGPKQEAARLEVVAKIGEEKLQAIERSTSAAERRRLITESIGDDPWLLSQVAASKIDGAEWVAREGAGAKQAFDRMRMDAVDYPVQFAREIVEWVEAQDELPDFDELPPEDRLARLLPAIRLAACVHSQLKRDRYAKEIGQLAGKGITKAIVLQAIASVRKSIKATAKERAEAERQEERSTPPPPLLIPPPVSGAVVPGAPKPTRPESSGTVGANGQTGVNRQADTRPAAPPPPQATRSRNEFEHFTSMRSTVIQYVERKENEDIVGRAIAQAITDSMLYTAFNARDELFLVRGNERIPARRSSQSFQSMLYIVSGLMPSKTTHRGYIDATLFHLRYGAQSVRDVSWCHLADDGAIYFSTGDEGKLLRLKPGSLSKTTMNEARVPAVAPPDFLPFRYRDREMGDGIKSAMELFRWCSLSEGDRLILLHWVAALPILHKVGCCPIVRIEGGSSSGKTRTVHGISWLVNGAESSSVPTAAALISCLSVNMLTIDDNRESRDVTPAFQGTLLQATHLGAREKRTANTDTGTIVERVTGALLMNGVEPIHDGKSELASRILTLRCHSQHRAPDSPTSNPAFFRELAAIRDQFWSESMRRCCRAMAWDDDIGERLGLEIEEMFGATRIGRLANYLRVMYLVWVAGLREEDQAAALLHVDPLWRAAYESIGAHVLDSLMQEDLVVQSIRYAFAHGRMTAEAVSSYNPEEVVSFHGAYHANRDFTEEYLGPIATPRLAQIVRSAGKELNAPAQISYELRAGQLEARLLDGMDIIRRAGFEVVVEPRERDGVMVWSFRRGETSASELAFGSPMARMGGDSSSSMALRPRNDLGDPPSHQESIWARDDGPEN